MIYPIPPVNGYGKEEMCYWEGFLTEADINLLLARPEWLSMEQGSIGKGTVDAAMRTTKVSWLANDPALLPIWEKLAKAVAEVNRRFFQFDLTGFYEPMQLGLYTADDKGHYDWHADASAKDTITPRKLSIALLLSDPSEFEGGEFQVKIGNDHTQTLETKRGRAWFFPSYALHRVMPVTKGMRRSLVLWVGGPQFK